MEVEYKEDALATIVSGLVLGCLLALSPDHHPVFVAVQSGNVWTLPAKQEERATPRWHSVDAGLAVPDGDVCSESWAVALCFGVAGSLKRGRNCLPSRRWKRMMHDCHVIVVHGSCTGGKACVPATLPTRKDGQWGVRTGR